MTQTWLFKPKRLAPWQLIAIKTAIHLLSIGLVAQILWLAINDTVDGDPVDAMLHFTGIGAINLLLLSLVVNPMAMKFKITNLILRIRLLGLYAFFYALLHLVTYIAFELQFEWLIIAQEIVKRPFIVVGMLAILLLFSLTLTSSKSIQKRMGKKWQTLHNWIYIAAPLTLLHYIWAVKSDIVQPMLYIFVMILLLWLRKDKLRRAKFF